MARAELRSLPPLAVAGARIAVRRARAAVRSARRPAAATTPGPRITVDGAVLAPAPPDRAIAAAIAAGVPEADARRAAGGGALLGLTVSYPDGSADAAVGRVDGGTATAELQFTPLGSPPDPRIAGPLAAYARHLLGADAGLRRVSFTVPAGDPCGASLAAAGFADEGWAPPVGDWAEATMFTYLR